MKPVAETVFRDYEWPDDKTRPELCFEVRDGKVFGCLIVCGESVMEFPAGDKVSQMHSLSELFRSAAEWMESLQ